MTRVNRREVLAEGEIQVVHCSANVDNVVFLRKFFTMKCAIFNHVP